jgi:hypothetical protein
MKKKEKWEKGHRGFYLSKEHYQQRFYMEPLLILDTINPGPAVRPESLHKILFPSHATAARPPARKPLEHMLPLLGPRCRRRCRVPIIAAATSMPGPLRRHRHPRARTSSTQPPRPLHHRCCWSATEDLYVLMPRTSALHLSGAAVDL